MDADPILTIYADGRIVIAPGATIGDVLRALQSAEAAVLNIKLTPPAQE